MNIEDIAVSNILPALVNPSLPDPHVIGQLADSIGEHGFHQPILVRDDGDETRLIDGHKRLAAVKKLGWSTIPSLIVTAAEHEVLSISMNKIRGELDLAAVGSIVDDLVANGYAVDDLTATGFSTGELTDLLDSISKTAEDLDELGAAPVLDAEDDLDPVERPYVLELTFASSDTLKTVKKALKKAAGKGGELSDGLLRLIDAG